MRLLLPWMFLLSVGCESTRPPNNFDAASTFGWLEGRWVGEGMGGTMEEVWLPSMDGYMLGTFRLLVGGEPQFYELMSIDPARGGERAVMRLKHFEPSLTSWEAKDEANVWVAERLGEHHARFDAIEYRLTSSDDLVVRMSDGKGGATDLVFHRAR